MLNDIERQRYSRQILLAPIGTAGQEKIKQARVLILGMGGLGCTVGQLLVSSGIGKIGIVDGDTIDLSNLQRQILFNPADVGKLKVEVAKARLAASNPDVEINDMR